MMEPVVLIGGNARGARTLEWAPHRLAERGGRRAASVNGGRPPRPSRHSVEGTPRRQPR
jgi:hypothetical protein